MAHIRATATRDDIAALRAFGVAGLTTNSAYVEPRWDYLPDTGQHGRTWQPAPRGTVGQHGAALQDLADDIEAMTLPYVAAWQASFDPQGVNRAVLALEHAATRLLALEGVRAPRPDVWSRKHRRHIARADVVAYKGQIRYQRPQPCRYGKFGDEPASMVREAVRHGDVTDVPTWERVNVAELLTTLAGEGPTRFAWRGHRRIVIQLKPRTDGAGKRERRAAASAATQAARAAAGQGKRGPVVSGWDRSRRTLASAVANAGRADRAASIAATLGAMAPGESAPIGDTVVTAIAGGSYSCHGMRWQDRTELARRLALI